MAKFNLNTILIVAVAVLVTLQLSSMFRKSPPNESLIRAEMKIEQLEEKRISDSLIWAEKVKAKDLEIASLNNKDTVVIQRINQSNDRIKKIPDIVRNLSNEDLRRAIYQFKP